MFDPIHSIPPLYLSDVQGFPSWYRTSVKDGARFMLIFRKKWIVNILDSRHCFRKTVILPLHPMKGETSIKWSIPLLRSGRLWCKREPEYTRRRSIDESEGITDFTTSAQQRGSAFKNSQKKRLAKLDDAGTQKLAAVCSICTGSALLHSVSLCTHVWRPDCI